MKILVAGELNLNLTLGSSSAICATGLARLVHRFIKTYPRIWVGTVCVVGQDGILRGDWQSPLFECRHKLREADCQSVAD